MRKPRIWSALSYTIRGGGREPSPRRIWVVDFEDSCGCAEEQEFGKFSTALRFAYHVAMGGSRWEFVA